MSFYYGAETALSMKNFNIGLPTDRMPLPIIKAFGLFKKACATVNTEFGLESKISCAITKACDDIIGEELNNQFPLSVWQTVSGTQTNVNVNEVISNRAIEILGGVIRSKTPVHPTDHVNKNQSSDRTFSTAMHIAATLQLNHELYSALKHLQEVFKQKSEDFSSISTFGQTHLPDAVTSQRSCHRSFQVLDFLHRLAKILFHLGDQARIFS